MRMRLSAILPASRRSITTPFTSTCLPVGGIPRNVSRWVPFQVKRVTTFSPSEICSEMLPVNVGEGRAKLHEDGLESFPALLLAGQRIEFDEVLKDKIVHAVEAALVENLVDEGADDFLVGG